MNMRAYLSEFTGTTILLATVIGSGIMGETLANGNAAIALLGNTIATGAILYVLITIFGPISGAHFNPTVTVAMLIAKKITAKDAIIFIILQILGAGLGVLIAHGMFELNIFQISSKSRQGVSQGFSEIIATFGLIPGGLIIYLTTYVPLSNIYTKKAGYSGLALATSFVLIFTNILNNLAQGIGVSLLIIFAYVLRNDNTKKDIETKYN